MSAEWLTAIATAGTFVVIAASAIAALMQLRHMRGSNQIVALTECRETLESPEFNTAQRFVSYELPRRLADPVQWRDATRLPFSGEYEAIGTVANFFESLGLFVKHNIIDRRIACDAWAFIVLRNWRALLPITTYVRTQTAPQLWEHFEYLAALSEEFMRKTAQSPTYPANVPHMPEDRSLLDRVEAEKSQAAR